MTHFQQTQLQRHGNILAQDGHTKIVPINSKIIGELMYSFNGVFVYKHPVDGYTVTDGTTTIIRQSIPPHNSQVLRTWLAEAQAEISNPKEELEFENDYANSYMSSWVNNQADLRLINYKN
jgi:hypothetical protein